MYLCKKNKVMKDKARKMAMGKKIKTIATNENKSIDEVTNLFCSSGTEEEQYQKLVDYVKEHNYKGKREVKVKEDKKEPKSFKVINLEVHSINAIINSAASDAEKLQKIKNIIEDVIANNEIVKLKEDIDKREKELEEDKRKLQDKIKNLG